MYAPASTGGSVYYIRKFVKKRIMRKLRFNALITAVFATLIFTAVSYTACKKKENTTPSVDTKCINVNCNNGSCLDGQCACYLGWEGIYCDIKTVSRYMGNWSAIETITLSTDTASVGDTFSYIFSIIPNGNDVLTFKIAGLMASDDTIVARLGNPQSHSYERLGYYVESQVLNNVNSNIPFVVVSAGGGRISSSGSTMDSMGYNRRYELITGNDTTFHKDTVRIVTQKIQ